MPECRVITILGVLNVIHFVVNYNLLQEYLGTASYNKKPAIDDSTVDRLFEERLIREKLWIKRNKT